MTPLGRGKSSDAPWERPRSPLGGHGGQLGPLGVTSFGRGKQSGSLGRAVFAYAPLAGSLGGACRAPRSHMARARGACRASRWAMRLWLGHSGEPVERPDRTWRAPGGPVGHPGWQCASGWVTRGSVSSAPIAPHARPGKPVGHPGRQCASGWVTRGSLSGASIAPGAPGEPVGHAVFACAPLAGSLGEACRAPRSQMRLWLGSLGEAVFAFAPLAGVSRGSLSGAPVAFAPHFRVSRVGLSNLAPSVPPCPDRVVYGDSARTGACATRKANSPIRGGIYIYVYLY